MRLPKHIVRLLISAFMLLVGIGMTWGNQAGMFMQVPKAAILALIYCPSLAIIWLWITHFTPRFHTWAIQKKNQPMSLFVFGLSGMILGFVAWPFYIAAFPPPKPIGELKVRWQAKRIMSDPPYERGTQFGGVIFSPDSVDIRLFLTARVQDIKQIDASILLINADGGNAGIESIGSDFPGISTHIVKQDESSAPNATVITKDGPVFKPGNWVSNRWRVLCPDIRNNLTAELALKIDLSFRTKMIQGLVVMAEYSYEDNGPKPAHVVNIIKFKDNGEPYSPDTKESQEIMKKYTIKR